MRKWMMVAMLIALIALTALTGCAAQPAKDEAAAEAAAPAEAREVVEVREKMFIAQINEIYLNADDYFGKTIRYEGVFDGYPYNVEGDMFYSVIRYGPGCCGDDGNVGFEVIWDKPYPKQGDWVSVEGSLERYEEYGDSYLRLRADKLTTLSQRGNETVSQ